MFDFITQPIDTLFTWISYALMFGAFITTLIVVGIIVAIPIGLKMLGVYFAKTIVIETTKVLKQLEFDRLDSTLTKTKDTIKQLTLLK